jgi:hypothetical protein
MRSDTKTISIQAAPEKVVEFLADHQNLPRWAVGFAKSVRQHQDRWLVTTGGGELPFRIEADARTGVVDYFISPAHGVEVLASSRVVPNGSGSEYVFTQFQAHVAGPRFVGQGGAAPVNVRLRLFLPAHQATVPRYRV